ncbi:MAG TPA: threonine synthase [Candidatus Saccharimonadales bacterium]|jgi:threonine synthase|nr:threonine synthase [Candidatus Saccharimonadales bacterium]
MTLSALPTLTAGHVLRCVHCGQVQRTPDPLFQCAECHELLEVVYPDLAPCNPEAALRLKQTWRNRRLSNAAEDLSGVWRFRELLPRIAPQHLVTLREGNTPLWPLHRAARSLGLEHVWVKHQGMNPTGSFKDTGMAAALSMARAQGFDRVCCASTGNTSASMAAYAARAGMKSIVLLPAGYVTAGKLAQALEFGATVVQLRTDFDGCLELLHKVVRRFRAYLLNSINPYRLEGQKTVAFELLDQLDWKVPDHIIVPGGNLGNSSALGKGLLELHGLGLIDRLPKISIIQAAGANPLVRTMRENGGSRLITVEPETRATAIRIGSPASWRKAVSVLQRTGGACEDVSEEEIAAAKAELGAEGIGCEPASATTLAGLKKLVRAGFVGTADTVVLILTGNMLKDVDYMLQGGGNQFLGPLDPDPELVTKTLEKLYARH